eukprot:CAMPEP_0178996936 /NCGR_PEP_ID=MMETSP0795-20121207/8652_1 /TAXON_ID=88552 /ORGANISM="Amoebophrya sp., Strain Ameob2" /LENGTH=333 /DNA_ID=CAMNT_0020689395 /DNA_START=101 /DNA_END=1102 /DNA_ORIENTATION=-
MASQLSSGSSGPGPGGPILPTGSPLPGSFKAANSYQEAMLRDRRSLEFSAKSQMLEGFAEDDHSTNIFLSRSRSYLSLLSELNKSKKRGRRRPAGVSAFSRDKENRWREKRGDFWDLEPFGQGVNCASSNHRNAGSIPPIGAPETVARKNAGNTGRTPPPGTYSLPELWTEAKAKKFNSRFDKLVYEIRSADTSSESHAVYGADGRFRLPLSEDEKMALSRIRKKEKMKAKQEQTQSPPGSPSRAKDHRGAIVLEGVNEALQDGRDNLLIHALMRDENERKHKETMPVMFKPPPEESEMEPDAAWDQMFAEKTKPDPISVHIATDGSSIQDLM